MSDRAHLEGPRGDGTFKWCVFPCQHPNPLMQDGAGRPDCRVPIHPQKLPNGHSWRAEGQPEAPTITPSINCMDDTCWHGWIVAGEVKNPRTAK